MSAGRRSVLILAAAAALAAAAFWQAAQSMRSREPRTLKDLMRKLGDGLGSLRDAADAGAGPEAVLALKDLSAGVARIPDLAPEAMRDSILFEDLRSDVSGAAEAAAAYANGSPDSEGLAVRYQNVRQACSKCHASFNRGKPF